MTGIGRRGGVVAGREWRSSPRLFARQCDIRQLLLQGMYLLSARFIAPATPDETTQVLEVLRGGVAVGGMEIQGRDSGRIVLERSLCRVGIPSNQAERAACREAIDFAGGNGAESTILESIPLLLIDNFDRLLAVAEKQRKSVVLHWGENSCRYKSASLFASASRWTLVSSSEGATRGWVGRRSRSNELLELESELEMPESVQAFALWLAALVLLELRE